MLKIMYFGADWCSPCKRMKPILDEFEQEHPEVMVVRFDVDVDSEDTLAFQINSVPTIVMMKDNEEFFRKRGALSKQSLENALFGESNG